MKSICVFAGSARGSKDSYSRSAKYLGEEIAKRKYSMVYGGGSNGLMGVVADAALEGGSCVTGIITKKLYDIEVGHENLTSLEKKKILSLIEEITKKYKTLSNQYQDNKNGNSIPLN